jgi:DNA-directed RNA polymerase specialized sigma24 family protein
MSSISRPALSMPEVEGVDYKNNLAGIYSTAFLAQVRHVMRQQNVDMSTAEDIVQQTYTNLLTRRPPKNIQASYVWKSLRNAQIDHSRFHKRNCRDHRKTVRLSSRLLARLASSYADDCEVDYA